MLPEIITQTGPNRPTTSPKNGRNHLLRCLDCGQIQSDPRGAGHCACGGDLTLLANPTEETTRQAIDWARQSITHLLWSQPPLTEFNPQRLESTLYILEQIQATLKPVDSIPSAPPRPSNGDAFCRAFGISGPKPKPHRHIADHWAEQATIALDALIEFRSAAHRWCAAGRVSSAELFAIVERLELAGLGPWFDHLVCVALVAEMVGEKGDKNGYNPSNID